MPGAGLLGAGGDYEATHQPRQRRASEDNEQRTDDVSWEIIQAQAGRPLHNVEFVGER